MKETAALLKGDPDAPFWDAWRDDERFLLHRCGICGRHEWPATCCIDHGMADMLWVEAPATGVVDTFTIFHRAYTKELAAEVPYVLAVVRLDAGPYFHTRITGIAADKVVGGMRVQLRHGMKDTFPLFVPIEP